MIQKLRSRFPDAGLMALVVAIFVLGGSARADVASVPLLRFLGCTALAYAMVTIPPETWRANRALLSVAFAWTALTALHLVPLPPSLWHVLPGRDLAVQIDDASGLGDVWRPLSLVPWRTLNALFSLTIPLAVLLLTLRLEPARANRLVYLLLALVLASAVLGLLQVIGGAGNPFYTYRVTNADSAVGLFANRNHNAVFLALGYPLIAASLSLLPAVAENMRLREWTGAGAGVLLIPFVLTTQSRAGILIGLVAIALALWTYRSPAQEAQRRRPRRQIDPRIAFGVLAGGGMVVLTMVFTATNAIERLGRLGQNDDELRWQIWPPIWRLVEQYLPFGSGIGTFVEIYKVAEPEQLLQPTYVNHAHNDWLEVMLEGGVPAIIIVAAALAILVIRGSTTLRSARTAQEIVLRRLGASICVLLALASVYDYPLRTPALAALLSVGVAMFLQKREAARLTLG